VFFFAGMSQHSTGRALFHALPAGVIFADAECARQAAANLHRPAAAHRPNTGLAYQEQKGGVA
jgi:hypothetical protein